MINISSSIMIYRPAEAVFDFISSSANDFEWQYGTLASSATSSTGSGEGATFQSVGHLMGRRVHGTFEVTEYEAGSRYGFRSLTGPMHIATLFTLKREKGATRVSVATRANPVDWADFNEYSMSRYMQKQAREDLILLRDILEARSGAVAA